MARFDTVVLYDEVRRLRVELDRERSLRAHAENCAAQHAKRQTQADAVIVTVAAFIATNGLVGTGAAGKVVVDAVAGYGKGDGVSDLVDYLRDKLKQAGECRHPRRADQTRLGDRLIRIMCINCGHEWLEEPR